MFASKTESMHTPHPRGSLLCWLFSGALLIASMLVSRQTVWYPICQLSGFNFLVVAGFVQERQPAPIHIPFTLGVSVLMSAVLAWGLWRKHGPVAVLPALVLLLSTCIIVLLCLRRNRALAAD